MANNNHALISFGSMAALTGFILSGPVGFAFVQLVKPLPRWTSAADFAAQYNALQNIPYYFGFILVGGMLLLSTAHYLNAEKALPLDKMHVFLSVVWTTIFATLIFFNYICQTAYIHHLASNYQPENDMAIAMFSMANPASLSWAIEMWGYAFLGVATWLLAAYYRERSRVIYILLIANGITSVFSAALYTYNAKWLLTTAGLAGYFVWNLLMIVLLLSIYRHAKKNAAFSDLQ
ncbi:MAG TPA: hypothetical protein VFL47_13870 [Flavisolibacter sp.]|nr:hypothetical protein [Flavisolibacter sp.]